MDNLTITNADHSHRLQVVDLAVGVTACRLMLESLGWQRWGQCQDIDGLNQVYCWGARPGRTRVRGLGACSRM